MDLCYYVKKEKNIIYFWSNKQSGRVDSVRSSFWKEPNTADWILSEGIKGMNTHMTQLCSFFNTSKPEFSSVQYIYDIL